MVAVLGLADQPRSDPHTILTESEDSVSHDALFYLYELLFSAEKITGPTNTMPHPSECRPAVKNQFYLADQQDKYEENRLGIS